jgi:hypothetical protein
MVLPVEFIDHDKPEKCTKAGLHAGHRGDRAGHIGAQVDGAALA